MKKIIWMAASLLLVLSCGEKPADEPGTKPGPTPSDDLQELSFSATLPALTKVSLTSELKLQWLRNDPVGILAFVGDDKTGKTTATLSRFTADKTGASTTLSGKAVAADLYVALYPYDESAGNLVKGVIPSDQTAVSTDEEGLPFHALAVAQGTGRDLAFQPLSALLKFTMASDAAGITGLEIRAHGALSGAFSPTVESGRVTGIQPGDGSKNYIYVKPASGAFQAGKTYYVEALGDARADGFTLTAYRGETAGESSVAFTGVLSPGKVVDLGTVHGNLSASEKSILGAWQVVRYASRLVDDEAGSKIWYSDAACLTVSSSIDNILTFNADGSLTVDQGEDRYSYLIIDNDDVKLDVDGDETWVIVTEGDKQFVQFGGGGFPGILSSKRGIDGKYQILSMGAGEIVLRDFETRETEDGEAYYMFYLQPYGVSRFYHKFVEGDFGISGVEDYYLELDGVEDTKHGSAVLEGIRWTLDVDTEEQFYSFNANAGLRIGIGEWRADSELYTPNNITFATEGIPGRIVAVKTQTAHITEDTDKYPIDIQVSATVGGSPFGTRFALQHESQVFTFSASEPKSGRLTVEWNKNSGGTGIFIHSIEVLYLPE